MAQPLADSDSQLIEDLCARYRDWAPLESAPPRIAERLEAGLSNRNILLRGANFDYVLRLPDQNPPPGVDRHRERHFASAAAAAGLAPPLLFSDPDRGIQITTFCGTALAEVPLASALVQLLNRIHTLAPDAERGDAEPASSSADQLRRHLEMPGQSTSLYRLLDACDPAIRSAMAVIEDGDVRDVPCHNDLLAANLRLHQGQLLALDWEYAAPGDPFFDLAVCVSDPKIVSDADTLLRDYLGRVPTPEEHERFTAQRVIYAAIACCWYDRHAPASDAAAAAGVALRTLSSAFGGVRPASGDDR